MNAYPFIEAERAEQRHVKLACELLEVSRAAFYQWAEHVPSERERADEALAPRIREIHETSRGTYGAPRVHAALHRDGVATTTKRVATLMRQQACTGGASAGSSAPRSPIPTSPRRSTSSSGPSVRAPP